MWLPGSNIPRHGDFDPSAPLAIRRMRPDARPRNVNVWLVSPLRAVLRTIPSSFWSMIVLPPYARWARYIRASAR
jgi:hypothetical protein